MNDLVTNLSVLAEDDGDRYPAHVKKLAEAAASRIAAPEAENERQAADIAEFMRRLGPRWFLDQNWFPGSVEPSDGL